MFSTDTPLPKKWWLSGSPIPDLNKLAILRIFERERLRPVGHPVKIRIKGFGELVLQLPTKEVGRLWSGGFTYWLE